MVSVLIGIFIIIAIVGIVGIGGMASLVSLAALAALAETASAALYYGCKRLFWKSNLLYLIKKQVLS